MNVNGEAFLLLNGGMNFLALLLCARALHLHLPLGRGMLAAALGSGYAAAGWALCGPWARGIPALALSGCAMLSFVLGVIVPKFASALSGAGIKSTATDFGLKVNDEVDMRYNVELETEAACRYFLKAYKRFNNWTLAAASFNAGTNRIDKFLREQKVKSYYDLLLPEETERYIFRILAVKTIFENPEKHGIYISKDLEYQPFKYKTVIVNESIRDFADFAIENGITYKLLKTFNPWLRSKSLKVKKGEVYEIKIPVKPFNITAEYALEAMGAKDFLEMEEPEQTTEAIENEDINTDNRDE